MTASELTPGEEGKIVEFQDEHLAILLNELGLFVGEVIQLTTRAPLGDPICIQTRETMVSIRTVDASQIIVKKLA